MLARTIEVGKEISRWGEADMMVFELGIADDGYLGEGWTQEVRREGRRKGCKSRERMVDSKKAHERKHWYKNQIDMCQTTGLYSHL